MTCNRHKCDSLFYWPSKSQKDTARACKRRSAPQPAERVRLHAVTVLLTILRPVGYLIKYYMLIHEAARRGPGCALVENIANERDLLMLEERVVIIPYRVLSPARPPQESLNAPAIHTIALGPG